MKKFRDIVSKDKVSGFEDAARNSIANRKQLDEEFELKLKKLTEEKVMKQTATKWLVEKLRFTHKEAYNDLYEVIQQALEMERQQIIASHDGFPIHARGCQDGEEYYKIVYED